MSAGRWRARRGSAGCGDAQRLAARASAATTSREVRDGVDLDAVDDRGLGGARVGHEHAAQPRSRASIAAASTPRTERTRAVEPELAEHEQAGERARRR